MALHYDGIDINHSSDSILV